MSLLLILLITVFLLEVLIFLCKKRKNKLSNMLNKNTAFVQYLYNGVMCNSFNRSLSDFIIKNNMTDTDV